MKRKQECLYEYNIKQTSEKKITRQGQDGGMGRNASLPCTTKGRITTNLKINLKKPELPENQTAGTPTTKELNSTKPVPGAESRSA